MFTGYSYVATKIAYCIYRKLGIKHNMQCTLVQYVYPHSTHIIVKSVKSNMKMETCKSILLFHRYMRCVSGIASFQRLWQTLYIPIKVLLYVLFRLLASLVLVHFHFVSPCGQYRTVRAKQIAIHYMGIYKKYKS